MKLRIENKFQVISKKSLFGKYINVSVLIVFLSFLVLGIILTLAISNYWANEKYLQLDNRARNYADFILQNLYVNEPISDNAESKMGINNVQNIRNLLSFIAHDAGVDIIVVNEGGTSQLVVVGDDNDDRQITQVYVNDIVQVVNSDGRYFPLVTVTGYTAVHSAERFSAEGRRICAAEVS